MLQLSIIIYIILALIKVWMFMYQRTALNICRSENIPLNLKGTMLPYWHVVVYYPITILKGILLVSIWIYSNWYIAVIIFIVDYVVTSILIPIPHSFFLDKMEKRFKDPETRLTKKGFTEENEEVKKLFLSAIKSLRERFDI